MCKSFHNHDDTKASMCGFAIIAYNTCLYWNYY